MNVDDEEENFDEEISLQDGKHEDNIDLDGFDETRWWKQIIILSQFSCINVLSLLSLINLNVNVIKTC